MGEGKWKVRQYGFSKRCTWHEIHLAVDSESDEIQTIELTKTGVHDAQAVWPMLGEVKCPLSTAAALGGGIRVTIVAPRQRWLFFRLQKPPSGLR